MLKQKNVIKNEAWGWERLEDKSQIHTYNICRVLRGHTYTFSYNHTNSQTKTEKTDIYFTLYLTRWLTDALHSLLLKVSQKQSPVVHNSTLQHVITNYFTASSLLRFLRTVDGYKASPSPQPELEKHNRQSSYCGKITTRLIFQVPVWIMNRAAEIWMSS